MDLALLSLDLKLVKRSNPAQNVLKTVDIAPANNLLNTMWSRSALYLNNVVYQLLKTL